MWLFDRLKTIDNLVKNIYKSVKLSERSFNFEVAGQNKRVYYRVSLSFGWSPFYDLFWLLNQEKRIYFFLVVAKWKDVIKHWCIRQNTDKWYKSYEEKGIGTHIVL